MSETMTLTNAEAKDVVEQIQIREDFKAAGQALLEAVRETGRGIKSMGVKTFDAITFRSGLKKKVAELQARIDELEAEVIILNEEITRLSDLREVTVLDLQTVVGLIQGKDIDGAKGAVKAIIAKLQVQAAPGENAQGTVTKKVKEADKIEAPSAEGVQAADAKTDKSEKAA